MKNSFEGKLALIIGGSEGIGFSVAKALVREGAHVFVASRCSEKLTAALQLLKQLGAEKVRLGMVTLDVADYEVTKKSLETLFKEEGAPDLVINCAGFARPGYLTDLPVDEVRRMTEVNLLGAFHVCKVVEPYLRQRGAGHIVNTSSIAGFLGLFGYTAYSATKFGVIGFSEALRRELKPFGVDVSVLCPPSTRTPGLEKENQFKPSEVLAIEEKVKVVEPDFVAQKLLGGIRKNKFLIIPTWDGKLAYYLNRYFPSVLDLFVRRPISVPRGPF